MIIPVSIYNELQREKQTHSVAVQFYQALLLIDRPYTSHWFTIRSFNKFYIDLNALSGERGHLLKP